MEEKPTGSARGGGGCPLLCDYLASRCARSVDRILPEWFLISLFWYPVFSPPPLLERQKSGRSLRNQSLNY